MEEQFKISQRIAEFYQELFNIAELSGDELVVSFNWI